MTSEICVWCNFPIKDNEEFNDLLGSLSHKRCDDKYFDEQEKRVHYAKKRNEYA